jgi:predicted RNase H-like HicB family nuclease
MDRLKVIVGPSSEGGYSATVPGLANCTYEAESPEDAVAQVREALSLYCDGGGKHQIEIEEVTAAERPTRSHVRR